LYRSAADVLAVLARLRRPISRVVKWSTVFPARFLARRGRPPGAEGGEGRGRPAPSGRRISWDVLRVAAVLCVVLYHGTTLGVEWFPELGERPVRFPYQVGASMLLLISGYFAARSLRRGDPLRWWVGRLCRIVPAYLAAVVVTAVVLRLTAPSGWWAPSVADVPVNWLMLWNWDPAEYAFVDPSYWTLPLQLIWFTALAWLFARGRPRSWGADGLLWAALAAQWLTWPLHVYLRSQSVRIWYEGLGVHRVHLFVAGLALYRWADGRLTHRHAAALVGSCVVAHRVQTGHAAWAVGIAVGSLAVAAAARGPDWNLVVRGRAADAVRWLAGIGYGIYLVHQAMGYRLMWWLAHEGVGPVGQMCAMIAASVLAGWALTALVERPAYAALMRRFDGGRGKDAPPPGPPPPRSPREE
jgi:peptidoglycan/LPS O-acetylase OafA/YrhL